jgi:hypothetical protein
MSRKAGYIACLYLKVILSLAVRSIDAYWMLWRRIAYRPASIPKLDELLPWNWRDRNKRAEKAA